MTTYTSAQETPGYNPAFPDGWFGSALDEIFVGSAGDDIFHGGQGSDTYYGGGGVDIIWYRSDFNPLQGVSVDLQAGTAIDPYGNSETFTSIEEIAGTRFDDIVYGSGDDNVFRGFEGDDFFDGRDGHDTFAYHLETGGNGITFNFNTGTATDTYGFTDTFVNVESVRASFYDDVLIGSGANERFRGMAGADVIDGGGGIDFVTYHSDAEPGPFGPGMAGVTVNLGEGWAIDGFGDRDTLMSIERAQGTRFDDILIGSDANNELRGLQGNDTLQGGKGNDLLLGGTGADTFVFAKGDGRDTVQDFDAGQGDLLDLGDAQIAYAFERDTNSDGAADATELLLTGGGRLMMVGVTGVADWNGFLV